MRVLGIDRVEVIVRDMDKALAYFSRLYGLEFEETSGARQSGLRICCDRPRRDIELISVVDRSRATGCRPELIEALELEKAGFEGPFRVSFSVEKEPGAPHRGQGARRDEQDKLLRRLAFVEHNAKDSATNRQIKSRGIDRVTILVKDIDWTADIMSRTFDMRFHELHGAVEFGGARCFVTVPDADVELVQVVDVARAASNPLMKHEVELAASGYEGPYSFWLRIDDGSEIAASAEQQGIPVQMLREGQHLSVDPPFEFKEVFFQDECLPVKRVYAMSKRVLPFSIGVEGK